MKSKGKKNEDEKKKKIQVLVSFSSDSCFFVVVSFSRLIITSPK